MNLTFLKLTSILSLLLFISCTSNQFLNEKDRNLPAPLFVSIKDGRIATDGGQSRGVAWGDYNSDGLPDLYVANAGGQWNALYRNRGEGNFKKVADIYVSKSAEVVIHGGNSQGVNWVDYDNDGDLDLYVEGRGAEANLLFRNSNNGSFEKIMDSPLSNEPMSTSMACWVDMEGDGDLDVFLAGYGEPNLLFENSGGGHFIRRTDHLLTSGEGDARACGCGDVNDDGLPEVYIANPRRPNDYFINLGNWNFLKVAEGHVVRDVGYSYGVSFADYDDDGDLDLFVANFDKPNALYNNDGQGFLTLDSLNQLTLEEGGASKGHSWGDYDNDTDLDLFVANGTYGPDMFNFLYLNQGDGSFMRNFDGELILHADTSAGVGHADYDRDGDLDLFVANWGGGDQVNKFYQNQTTGSNWITFRLTGTVSNKFGIGAKMAIQYTHNDVRKRSYRWMYPVTGYGSQNDYELHFGLDQVQLIDSIIIKWPSGQIDRYGEMPVNERYEVVEGDRLSSEK